MKTDEHWQKAQEEDRPVEGMEAAPDVQLPETAAELAEFGSAMEAFIQRSATEAKEGADASFEGAATRLGIDAQTAAEVALVEGVADERAAAIAEFDAATAAAHSAIEEAGRDFVLVPDADEGPVEQSHEELLLAAADIIARLSAGNAQKELRRDFELIRSGRAYIPRRLREISAASLLPGHLEQESLTASMEPAYDGKRVIAPHQVDDVAFDSAKQEALRHVPIVKDIEDRITMAAHAAEMEPEHLHRFVDGANVEDLRKQIGGTRGDEVANIIRDLRVRIMGASLGLTALDSGDSNKVWENLRAKHAITSADLKLDGVAKTLNETPWMKNGQLDGEYPEGYQRAYDVYRAKRSALIPQETIRIQNEQRALAEKYQTDRAAALEHIAHDPDSPQALAQLEQLKDIFEQLMKKGNGE